ncbi:MAG: diguanylate cyclase domain-containing protein [Bacillota bacterium]
MEKIFRKFKYIIIIILAVFIIIMFSNQYLSINQIIEEKYKSRQNMVEKNILQTVNYINDAYKIAEQQLNQQMKKYSEQMVKKYKVNSDVMEWDLESMQQQFSGYDIYIVNKDLKIIKTTYKEDLGLDFSRFGSFATVLQERMSGSKFEVDRIDISTQAGEIKKYSYMPSPDNQYLFELSVSIEDKYPSFKSLNLFKDAAVLTGEYEMVEDIAFYSVEPLRHGVAKLRNSKRPYLNPDVPEFEEELARQAVINNDMQKSVKIINGIKHRYRFFPALINDEENEQGWNSYVVGITYNDQIMQEEMSRHRHLFFINILMMAVFLAVFIAVVVYLLKKFEHQAYHDKLTGLANRKYFAEEFEELREKADFSRNSIGVIFIDIDDFKAVNDNFGHDVGDKVLKSIASRIKNSLKEKDLKARMGGDEFIIAIADLNSRDKIIKIAERLIDGLKKPLVIENEKISVNVSAGISIYPDDSKELETLIKYADTAMYKAKKENEDIAIN